VTFTATGFASKFRDADDNSRIRIHVAALNGTLELNGTNVAVRSRCVIGYDLPALPTTTVLRALAGMVLKSGTDLQPAAYDINITTLAAITTPTV